jgi:hypothetical protein
MSNTLVLPNSAANLQKLAGEGRITRSRTAAMLFSRILLFAFWQAVIAAILALCGSRDPWTDSAAWWPASVTLTNIVIILLLGRSMKADGMQLRDLYRTGPMSFWRELLIILGTVVVSAPLSYLPNIGMAALLWGGSDVTAALFFRPLPLWSLVAFVILLPVTQAFAEGPTYFAYAMPRIKALTGRAWMAIAAAAFMLAAQHMAFPLVFDGRFLIWRLTMFIPFAAWTGLIMYWRPRLLPFLMVVHALLDATLFLYLFPLAT